MRLSIAVELTCSTESLAVTPNDRVDASFPITVQPQATFATQLLEPYLRLPWTRAQRRFTQERVSGSYAATSSLSLREEPTLDRSV